MLKKESQCGLINYQILCFKSTARLGDRFGKNSWCSFESGSLLQRLLHQVWFLMPFIYHTTFIFWLAYPNLFFDLYWVEIKFPNQRLKHFLLLTSHTTWKQKKTCWKFIVRNLPLLRCILNKAYASKTFLNFSQFRRSMDLINFALMENFQNDLGGKIIDYKASS